MNFLESIAHTIAQQTQKQHSLFLGIILGCAGAATGGIIAYGYLQRQTDTETILQYQEQAKKNDKLIMHSSRIKTEEERIQALLEENKGFSIKTFFETLILDQKLTPEPGWDTEVRSIEGNETFDEIVLTATFKNQTTQSLVTLLNVLETNEIVYIKELEIKKQEKKTISFEIIIATKKRKQFWED